MTATYVAHAVFGPRRPVLVLTITGEIDLAGDEDLARALRRVGQVPGAGVVGDPDTFRAHFGCRELAPFLVIDLRNTTFVSAHALARLVNERDEDGRPPRVLVARAGAVRRALAAGGLDDAVELYADLADAVLAEAPV